MNKIKKFTIVSVILTVSTFFILCLCGCTDGTKETSEDTTTVNQSTTSYSTNESTLETTANEDQTTSVAEKHETTTEKQQNKSKTSNGSSNTHKNSQSTTTTKKSESYCTNNNSHTMMCGDMGKWFNSRSELEAYNNSVVESWNKKLDSCAIDWKEYVKKCPQGFEAWSCARCGKWTGNFKYDTVKRCTEGGTKHWSLDGPIGWCKTYEDAKSKADTYLKNHSNYDGYTISQCDCGLYTAQFYNINY